MELSKALVALKPASADAKAVPGDSKALVDLSTALVDLKAAPGNYKAAVGNYKAATEKSIGLAENFKASTQKRKAFTPEALSFYAKAPLMQEPNFSDPFDKPMGAPPPETLREARLSPWWPQYKEAMQKEYDGHIKSGTWELVSKQSIPKGKNILRGNGSSMISGATMAKLPASKPASWLWALLKSMVWILRRHLPVSLLARASVSCSLY